MSTPPVLGCAELLRLCAAPLALEAYSPLAEYPCLLFDAAGSEHAAPHALSHAAQRLRALPCPVLALGSPAPALLRGVDALLRDAEVALFLDNIARHPLAAMTLVQVLRHNEDADVAQGLLAESLAYATLQAGPEFAAVRAAGFRVPPVAQGDAPAVLLAREDDCLAIRLNRPAARNAYNTAMRDGLFEALQLLRADPSLSRAVVRGEGDCFSVGGDLAEFGCAADPATAHAVRCSRHVGRALHELAPRLVFHLHRACIGAGIELPAFAGRVVARHDTFVQLPELSLGLIPGAGGTVSILRRVGRQRTAWLALSGRRLRAQQALSWGLVDALE